MKPYLRWAVSSTVVTMFASVAGGQSYPSTLEVPVTYFDYHSDSSCPDFNPGTFDGRNVNADMVDRQLITVGPFPEYGLDSAYGVPQKKVDNPNIYFSYGLNKWFRPWETVKDYEKPVYEVTPSGGELIRIDSGPDTMYQNAIINDYLTFDHVGNGVYEYARGRQFDTGHFLPIDDRGLGNDQYNNNYSFAMMLHWDFKYRATADQTFDFTGDDDVWVFVDGQLVLDLGGIHGPVNGSFTLGEIGSSLGLVNGETYTLSFFYCERQHNASTIRVTTNIIQAKVTELLISATSDSIEAGGMATLTAAIEDEDGVLRTDLLPNVTWRMLAAAGKPGDELIDAQGDNPPRGEEVGFTGTQAYHEAIIIASYGGGSSQVSDTVAVYIYPGPPSQVFIEEVSDTPMTQAEVEQGRFGFVVSPPDSVGKIEMGNMDSLKYAYAVARDKYGNYVRMATGADWSLGASEGVEIQSTANKAWEGQVIRTGRNRVETEVTAREPGLTPGTASLEVASLDPVPTEIKISADPPTIHAGDSSGLTVQVLDQDGVPMTELPDYVLWSLDEVEVESTDYLTNDEGSTTAFTSTAPDRSAVIRATYMSPEGDTLTTTISIRVDRVPIELEVLSKTPSSPATDRIPQDIRDVFAGGTGIPEFGMFAQIKVTNRNLAPNETLDARVSIFDAVGNLVMSCTGVDDASTEMRVAWDGESKLYIYWSGRNTNGRLAASGAYLALADIKYNLIRDQEQLRFVIAVKTGEKTSQE